MSQPRVYLAGPINALSYAEATGWRTEARLALAKRGIAAFSPMRAKEFLSDAKDCTWVGQAHAPGASRQTQSPLATARGIMVRDHLDCTKADALLVNYTENVLSTGTTMEQAWAYDRGIPVVVVCPPGHPGLSHPMWLETVDFRVDTLAEGIALIATILLP